MHQTSGQWRLGLALSLLSVILWGVLPIALKVVLQVLDVYTITWFRFLGSFILLAVYLGIQGKLPKSAKLQSTSWQLLIIATVFLAGNYILFVKGLALTTAANAEVIIQLAPVLFGMCGLILFKERYNRLQWLGVSGLTLGLVLFFHEQVQNLITASRTYLIGSSLLVLGAVSWVVYGLAQKQLLQNLPSYHILLIIYGGCTLLFSPFANPQSLLTLSPLHLGMLLFCALNTVLAYGAFSESLEHCEVSRISAVSAITPIVTIVSVELVSFLAPRWIAPEKLTILGISGAILVVVGSIVIALGKSR